MRVLGQCFPEKVNSELSSEPRMKRSKLCKGRGRAGSRQREVRVKWFSTCSVKCCERLLGRHSQTQGLAGISAQAQPVVPQATSLRTLDLAGMKARR